MCDVSSRVCHVCVCVPARTLTRKSSSLTHAELLSAKVGGVERMSGVMTFAEGKRKEALLLPKEWNAVDAGGMQSSKSAVAAPLSGRISGRSLSTSNEGIYLLFIYLFIIQTIYY